MLLGVGECQREALCSRLEEKFSCYGEILQKQILPMEKPSVWANDGDVVQLFVKKSKESLEQG